MNKLIAQILKEEEDRQKRLDEAGRQQYLQRSERMLQEAIETEPMLGRLLQEGALTFVPEERELRGEELAPVLLRSEYGSVVFSPATWSDEGDAAGWIFPLYRTTGSLAAALADARRSWLERQEPATVEPVALECPFLRRACLRTECALWAGNEQGGHCALSVFGDIVDVLRHIGGESRVSKMQDAGGRSQEPGYKMRGGAG